MTQNVVQKKHSIADSVVGIRLPLGAEALSNAENVGKEPTRMKNRAESVHTSTTTNERVSPLRKLIAIGALSTIALTGCAADNSNAAPEPSETSTVQPQETETPAPTETEAPEVTFEEQVAELELPAGMDNEALRTEVPEFLSSWINAGADDGLRDRIHASDGPREEVIHEVVLENRDLYATALFGPDWESNQQAITFADKMAQHNSATLQWYAYTAWSDSEEDVEAYRAWVSGVTISDLADDGSEQNRRLVMVWDDNSEMNRADDGEANATRQIDFGFVEIGGVTRFTGAAPLLGS